MEETKLMQSLERLNDRLKQSKNNRYKKVAKNYDTSPIQTLIFRCVLVDNCGECSFTIMNLNIFCFLVHSFSGSQQRTCCYCECATGCQAHTSICKWNISQIWIYFVQVLIRLYDVCSCSYAKWSFTCSQQFKASQLGNNNNNNNTAMRWMLTNAEYTAAWPRRWHSTSKPRLPACIEPWLVEWLSVYTYWTLLQSATNLLIIHIYKPYTAL